MSTPVVDRLILITWIHWGRFYFICLAVSLFFFVVVIIVV
jgi:hypothetical protein